MKPCIQCRLVAVKESHEGSGGGFSVVRFFYLEVENRTHANVRSVKAKYCLLKGTECFQEDELIVEDIAAGQCAKSSGFIRESPLFDRIEWVSEPIIETDWEIEETAILFDKRIPTSFPIGCMTVSLVGLALLVILLYRVLSTG